MMTRNCIESAQFLIQVNRKGAGWAMNPLLHIHLNPLDKPTQNGYNIVKRLNKYLIKIHREVSWMKKTLCNRCRLCQLCSQDGGPRSGNSRRQDGRC